MSEKTRTPEYLLNTSQELGGEQLSYLDELLNAETTRGLGRIGVPPAGRCLDLGAGSGSISRWLAEHTGPSGTVVAVDLDTSYLTAQQGIEQQGIEVYQHDLNDGLPVGGEFDLIHARLLLMHLRQRERILAMLAGALRPRGWLVLGEYCGPPLRVHSAPSQADEALFGRMQQVTRGAGERGGISYSWATQVGVVMRAAGLTNVHSREHPHTTVGGDVGSRLHRNYNLQAEPLLRDAGVSSEELDRYRTLVLDPRFSAEFYRFVLTAGQSAG